MKNHRNFIVSFAWAMALATLGVHPVAAAERARPNVLLIVADDLGFSDLGSYGGEIRTPNLDRLAGEGARFTQFYNCSVCVSTRASLMTGLFPRRDGELRSDMVTLGEVMQQAGYATGLSGKWHLGQATPLRPIDRGFAEYYGIMSGASNYFDPSVRDPKFYDGEGRGRPFGHNETIVTKFPPGYYTTDAFADHTITMIRQSAANRKPFFLNLNFTAPHFPLQVPAADVVRYREKYRDGYQRLREDRFRRQIQLGILDPENTKLSPVHAKGGGSRYDFPVSSWEQLSPEDRRREEERMEVYAAMVDRLDQAVGRVLAALEEAGVANNTVVFFISDNGGCAGGPEYGEPYLKFNEAIPVGDGRGYEFVGPGWGWAQNAPFRRHKTWTYEGGVATPMIVRWPGVVPSGKMIKTPAHVLDFMPTLLELSGGQYPENFQGRPILPLEGRSLVPILKGAADAKRPAPLYWELFGNRAMRDGDWKTVWNATDRRWELYDLASDRSETLDLSARYTDRVTAMAAAWSAWYERKEAPGK